MTYYADLTPYSYLEEVTDPALNVGWLDAGHDFPRGPVPVGFADALAGLIVAGQVNLTRGWHRCGLGGCANPDRPVVRSGDAEQTLGAAEVWPVGADGTAYAAPTLVHHYVTEHGYRPPDPFVEAVLAA
jgi:hypothetical protein